MKFNRYYILQKALEEQTTMDKKYKRKKKLFSNFGYNSTPIVDILDVLQSMGIRSAYRNHAPRWLFL